jgi:NADH dehydrogenase [ubiquinone] 1 alpha subcomplex assembly factor 6
MILIPDAKAFMQKNSLSYCGDLVMRNDSDHFLISLFADTSVREDIWALLAFNYEISKTRSVVSESTLGLIRLQWWRDQVAAIYDNANPPAHEVLVPLAAAIHKHKLPKIHFETLIHAREFDLEDVLPGNLEGLMNYADFTTTPLLKLLVQITGDDPEILPIQPIGINVGLASVIMNAPYHAKNARCYWPEDLMQKHGLTRDNFYNAEKREEFQNIVETICMAKTSKIRVENKVLKAFDTLACIYFKQIKSLKYNIFSPKIAIQPPFKALRLWIGTKF